MPVRIRRIAGPVVLSGSTVLIYTVPAGRTLQLNTIWLANADPAVESIVTMYVNGAVVANRVLRVRVPADNSTIINSRMVLNPGDTLYATRSAGTVNLIAAGSLLDGEPT